jgi:hypothetical protein
MHSQTQPLQPFMHFMYQQVTLPVCSHSDLVTHYPSKSLIIGGPSCTVAAAGRRLSSVKTATCQR